MLKKGDPHFVPAINQAFVVANGISQTGVGNVENEVIKAKKYLLFQMFLHHFLGFPIFNIFHT